jgi:EmrB/QacA subfamily drug resistance transporter
MVALMITMLLPALDQTIVATALPKIAADFNALDGISWAVTAYLLASAVTTPLYGKLSDLFGRKRMLLLSIIIFLLGSLLAGVSQSMIQLVLFRGLQGLGAGGLMTLVLATVGDIVPMRDRGRYQGIFGAVWGLSSVVGPLLGGFLTDRLSWRWIFYVNLPVGLTALILIWLRLTTPVSRTERTIDYLGTLLLAVSSIALLLVAARRGPAHAWLSPQILLLLALGIAFAVLFVLWERRAVAPLLPLSLFNNSIFTASILLSLVSSGAMFVAVVFLPEYQQIVRGHTATASGLLMLPFVVGLLFASIGSGAAISSTGRYQSFRLSER